MKLSDVYQLMRPKPFQGNIRTSVNRQLSKMLIFNKSKALHKSIVIKPTIFPLFKSQTHSFSKAVRHDCHE